MNSRAHQTPRGQHLHTQWDGGQVGLHTQSYRLEGLVLRKVGSCLVLRKVGSHTQAGSLEGLVLRKLHERKEPGLLVVK
jgi:hypothetical protein